MKTMGSITCLGIFLTCLSTEVYTATFKRQGLFTCHGWGAGCDVDWRPVRVREPRPDIFVVQQTGPFKESSKPTKVQSAPKPFSPTFLFTSGSSWTPIGKRTQKLDTLRQLLEETENHQASNELLPMHEENYSYDP